MSLYIVDNVLITLALFMIYLKVKRLANCRYVRVKIPKIFCVRYILLFIAYVFHVMSVINGAWLIFVTIYRFM